MRVIQLEQRSDEWFSFRRDKISASLAPIICGQSLYQTRYGLWSELLGLTPPRAANIYMQRGIDMEAAALWALNEWTGRDYKPAVILHETIPYMMASLDGMTSDQKHIAEIKCPGKKDQEIAQNGLVPDQYFAQLQHQIECSGLECVDYWSFDGSDGVLITVPREQEFIDWMLKQEKQFWECLKNLEAPDLMDGDYVRRRDEEWTSCVSSWRMANARLKESQEQERLVRERLVTLSGGQNSQGSGLKLSKVTRKGAIEYDSIPHLKGLNLEGYRKKTVVSWRISTND